MSPNMPAARGFICMAELKQGVVWIEIEIQVETVALKDCYDTMVAYECAHRYCYYTFAQTKLSAMWFSTFYYSTYIYRCVQLSPSAGSEFQIAKLGA